MPILSTYKILPTSPVNGTNKPECFKIPAFSIKKRPG